MIEIIKPTPTRCKVSDIPEGGYFCIGDDVYYRGQLSLNKTEVSVAPIKFKPTPLHWMSAYTVVTVVKDIKVTVQL